MSLIVTARAASMAMRLLMTLWLGLALGAVQGAQAKVPFSAIAIDARTGKLLAGTDVDGARHPASLTKIMTLYLLFQDLNAGRIKLSTKLVVSRRASGMAPSKLGLKPGSTITVETAIKALVTKSANDVAATVGENLGGSEANFAGRMTRVARSLGMKRTTFLNASGLPNPGQWTTARDMATLGLRVQRDFPQYYPYFRISTFTYNGRAIRNHNRLLGRYAGTDGIKTGYIRASGFNLVTSAKRGNRRVVGVVLGGRSGGSRNAYMMSMLNSVFPKCVNGSSIAALAGSSAGAIIANESPRLKSKPLLASAGAAAAAEIAGGMDGSEPSAMQAVTADAENAAVQDTQVLEAKMDDTADVAAEELEEGGTGVVAESSQPPPEKLPFAVKTAGAGGTTTIVASIDNAWTIQVGAFPEKQAAERRLADILAAHSAMLAGKPALTIEAASNKGKIYRARFSGFSLNAAKDACRQLAKRGSDCMPMSPQS
jgi:D-alanyl-D-alanine carboxypeptidase